MSGGEVVNGSTAAVTGSVGVGLVRRVLWVGFRVWLDLDLDFVRVRLVFGFGLVWFGLVGSTGSGGFGFGFRLGWALFGYTWFGLVGSGGFILQKQITIMPQDLCTERSLFGGAILSTFPHRFQVPQFSLLVVIFKLFLV